MQNSHASGVAVTIGFEQMASILLLVSRGIACKTLRAGFVDGAFHSFLEHLRLEGSDEKTRSSWMDVCAALAKGDLVQDHEEMRHCFWMLMFTAVQNQINEYSSIK